MEVAPTVDRGVEVDLVDETRSVPSFQTSSSCDVDNMETVIRFFERRSMGVIPRARVRKTIVAASMGSDREMTLVSKVIGNLHSADDAIHTLTLFGDLLDIPVFEASQQFTPMQQATGELVLLSLLCLSSLPAILFSDARSPEYAMYVKIWPNILKWLRYLFDHLAPTPKVGPPSEPDSFRNYHPDLFVVLGMFVEKIRLSFRALYENAILDDRFLDLIVKAWLRTKDQGPSRPDITFPYPLFNEIWVKDLWLGLSVLYDKNDKKITEARKMILAEAGGDAASVVKHVLRRIRHSNKMNRDEAQFFPYAAGVIYCLCDARHGQTYTVETIFMSLFFKEDIVSLVLELLVVVVDDISRPLQDQLLQDGFARMTIQRSLGVLFYCFRSKNGMHWAMVMLKLGFLHTIAGILAFPTDIGDYGRDVLRTILGRYFPALFCHRVVIRAALKAIRDITIDGRIEHLRTGLVKEEWERFENVLLERAVFNAIYDRDFADNDARQCFACGKSSLEMALSKCARCGVNLYCSKECQALSWKELGHRQICKTNTDSGLGTVVKSATSNFERILGVFELHRNAPGILRQLLTEPHWNNGGDLSQVPVFSLNFGAVPPIGIFMTAKEVEETYGPTVPMETHKTAGRGLYVISSFVYGLGGRSFAKSFVVPKSFIEGVEGESYDPGDAEHTLYSRRTPLRDKDGKFHVVVMDEIDEVIADARTNFHPLSPGETPSPASPKTVYEYVQQKVAERRPEAWTKCIRIRHDKEFYGRNQIFIEEENSIGSENDLSV